MQTLRTNVPFGGAVKASGAWLPSLRGTCGPCSSIISISLRHTCDKDKEGFAATFPYEVKVVWTAWRRGLAMVVGKQKGRAVSPPFCFQLALPIPSKTGTCPGGSFGVERLYANC